MFYDKDILFLSAFGQPCNIAYKGTAVEKDFGTTIDANRAIVFPWTSATPLSGELLQASLDALLQNDLNLLSAYPDAYMNFGYTENPSPNDYVISKFEYGPAGAGQAEYNKYVGVKVGDDIVAQNDNMWENSVTISACVSDMGGVNGYQSAFILGSTVPAYPFRQNRAWNYGVFGVKNGKPTWFDIDVETLNDSIDPEMMAKRSYVASKYLVQVPSDKLNVSYTKDGVEYLGSTMTLDEYVSTMEHNDDVNVQMNFASTLWANMNDDCILAKFPKGTLTSGTIIDVRMNVENCYAFSAFKYNGAGEFAKAIHLNIAKRDTSNDYGGCITEMRFLSGAGPTVFYNSYYDICDSEEFYLLFTGIKNKFNTNHSVIITKDIDTDVYLSLRLREYNYINHSVYRLASNTTYGVENDTGKALENDNNFINISLKKPNTTKYSSSLVYDYNKTVFD